MGSACSYFMILIDVCYKPVHALPVVPPFKPSHEDPPYPLDREIVNFLRDQQEVVETWKMVNAVAASLNPKNRSESRALKLQIMARITPLVYARRVRRVGRKYL